ncbi:hypothetical protein C2E20_7034 [Micractinium conductrix]|uniref:Uncharacterized protein n=1 Tax=Micractinium conductrix TaxID=554055 RepID=A0A2P6V606_9CHLO|nr:hypothetical protein C2E20_7034 [Micractinium conductrix]|eukprot:PSC69525.1 hypothetical protein C2E20_7034 [Micractinium conductrix]
MRGLLEQKAVSTDRAVLFLIVGFNVAALAKLQLKSNTLIGAFNGSLAGALLVASIWRPTLYSRCRLLPIVLLRLAVCALPLVADTVGPFGRGCSLPVRLPAGAAVAWQLGRGLLMLCVGLTWTVGLFTATFLLLPPLDHVAVSSVSLTALLLHNRTVCERFLEQHPSNGAVVDALDVALRALVVSTAPVAQAEMGVLGGRVGRQVACQAGAAAIQVSLGVVLPTMLAWQLQCRMAASIAEHADATHNAELSAQVRRSKHVKLCAALSHATQGQASKVLLTGGCMLLTYVAALLVLA